jgi:YVTN family beta-propeller protein
VVGRGVLARAARLALALIVLLLVALPASPPTASPQAPSSHPPFAGGTIPSTGAPGATSTASRGIHSGALPIPSGPFGRGPPRPAGTSSIGVGTYPFDAAYDGANGWVYVTDEDSNNVSVIKGTQVLRTIPVGDAPGFATFDPANGCVYVANFYSDSVSVLRGLRVIGTVAVGPGPSSMAYDGRNGYIYVPNADSDTLSVINGTSNVALVTVGALPDSATYDNANGYVYVSNEDSANVTVLNGTSVVAWVKVGAYPYGAAYDRANGYVYVPNYGTNNVSVLNGTNVVTSLKVDTGPLSATYDDGTDLVYVADQASANVSVINGTTVVGTVKVGVAPYYPGYVNRTGELYVPSEQSDTVSVINGTRLVGTIAVGANPFAAVYDPADGFVYVPNSGSNNVSAIVAGSTVTFTEDGLPTGTEWWVNITGGPSTLSNGTSLAINEFNGTYAFSVATANKTYSTTLHGSFTVAGADLSETVRFRHSTYPVTFTESGLAPGTNWSVSLGGVRLSSAASAIAFAEPNGSYAYAIAPLPGWVAPVYASSLAVNGSAVDVAVPWTRVTYLVTFIETGLSASGWRVNVTGGPSTASDTTALSFSEPNGTYRYSVVAVNTTYETPGGSFVVNGTPVVERLSFSQLTYNLTFLEKGLPSGTDWSVTLGGAIRSSDATVVTFTMPNGTYAFSVGFVAGLVPDPSTGSVVVAGANTTLTVVFGVAPPSTYTVTFAETGLPTGTIWSVTFSGIPESGKGELPFPGIANGTYNFSVTPIVGFTAAPSHGSVSVHGAPVPQPVAFRPVLPTSPSPTLLGLPEAEVYAVVGGFLIAVLVVAMSAVWVRRKGRRRPGRRT